MSAASSKPVRAVIHWEETDEVSIENVSKITKEEERFVNSKTNIKAGGKSYKVTVRLISRDDEKLEECEEVVAQEIEARRVKAMQTKTSSDADKKSRSLRKKKTASPNKVSARELALAIGEKPKPMPHTLNERKDKTTAQKSLLKAQETAQMDIDEDVFNASSSVKSHLFTSDSHVSDDDNTTMIDDAAGSEDEKQSEVSDDEGLEHLTDEKSDNEENVMKQDEKSGQQDVKSENNVIGSDSCCSHCKELSSKGKGSALGFMQCIQKYISGFSSHGDAGDKTVAFLPLKPLDSKVQKCELSRKSGVFIAAADKNELKSKGGGDPAKMVRMGLLMLYGREAVENADITVKGTKKGSLALHGHVLSALLSFVNRNVGPNYEKLTESRLNSIINRKKYQVQRTTKSPNSSLQRCHVSSKERITNKAKKLMSPKKKFCSKPTNSVPMKDHIPADKPTDEVDLSKAPATPSKSTNQSPAVSSFSSGGSTVNATSPWKMTGNRGMPYWPPQFQPYYRGNNPEMPADHGFSGHYGPSYSRSYQPPSTYTGNNNNQDQTGSGPSHYFGEHHDEAMHSPKSYQQL